MNQIDTLTIETSDSTITVSAVGSLGLLAWNALEWQLLRATGTSAVFRSRGFRVVDDESTEEGWRPVQELELHIEGGINAHQRRMLLAHKPLTMDEAWAVCPDVRLVEFAAVAA